MRRRSSCCASASARPGRRRASDRAGSGGVKSRRQREAWRSVRPTARVRTGSNRCARRPAAPAACTPSPARCPGGHSAGNAPAGESTSVQRSRARSWACAHRPCMSLTCALAIWAASSLRTTSSVRSGAKASAMRPCSTSRCRLRRPLSAKRGSSASAGCCSTCSQKRRHSRSFCAPSITLPPSPTGYGPYGEMVGCAAPLRGGPSAPSKA